MKSIVLEKPGQFRMVDAEPPPDPKQGEALVRPGRIGICGTDLHAFQGNQPYFNYPRVLGHELGVEIVAIGENEYGLAPGDRCALEPYLNCGRCVACRRGKTNCCVALKVLGVHIDGGMRDQFKVPISKLHKSSQLSLEQLALVETLGIGAHAVRRAAPERGETALVVGVGPIGLSVVMFARQAGAEIAILDASEKRLEFCRRTFNVAHSIHAKDDALPKVLEALSGELPTLVFDCTGNPASMQNAFRYFAHGGKLIFVGLFIGDVTFNDPDFHRRETTLLSSRNSTAEDFRRIIRLMESGEIDVTPWITQRVPSSALIEIFPQWVGGSVLKAIIEW